jgi:cation diffusion facilitator CzcD-associated flavoprotein CzcO
MSHTYKSDIIIIGGGLAGIVTAIELPGKLFPGIGGKG